LLLFIIFLFRHGISELRGPIAAKFGTVVYSRLNFRNWVRKFEAAKKNIGTKNLQNFTWFQKTSHFSGEYFRNGWRYSQSDKYLINRNSFRIRWKKVQRTLVQ